jgi:hypothetical protein
MTIVAIGPREDPGGAKQHDSHKQTGGASMNFFVASAFLFLAVPVYPHQMRGTSSRYVKL